MIISNGRIPVPVPETDSYTDAADTTRLVINSGAREPAEYGGEDGIFPV
ncbi:MAG: hypothetical protein WD604_11930 [Balneolaceae bacterium]